MRHVLCNGNILALATSWLALNFQSDSKTEKEIYDDLRD